MDDTTPPSLTPEPASSPATEPQSPPQSQTPPPLDGLKPTPPPQANPLQSNYQPTPPPSPSPIPPAQPQMTSDDTKERSGVAFERITGFFLGILNWVVIPIVIVFILHNFVFQAFHVVGSSMNPTLNDSDYIIVSKVDKTISQAEHKTYIPHRYDIVVFHYPRDPNLIFVKRAIGLPGEHVVVKDGNVTVYNNLNPGGFSPDLTTYQRAAATTMGNFDDIVPSGDIFVLGDNRTPNGSFDSREWGFLPSSYIVGKAVIRLLPLDTFRLFSNVQFVIRTVV